MKYSLNEHDQQCGTPQVQSQSLMDTFDYKRLPCAA